MKISQLDCDNRLAVGRFTEPAARGLPSNLILVVVTALVARLIVIPFVYQGFLEPGRDHWEFGFEAGRIAKSIVTGHGFGNPYWPNTGPTALLTPVYPYLIAAIFLVFGITTKAAAITLLSLNSLLAALTAIPVFCIARGTLGIRAANWAVWMWAFFPYSIYFSADSSWYHSLLALLVAILFLISLRLEDAKTAWPWFGFGIIYGLAALTNPVVLAVFPILAGRPCYRRYRQRKNFRLAMCSAVAGLLLLLTPWSVRNYMAFGRPVFLKDNFWMEFCVGNLGNSVHWWNGNVHPAGSKEDLQAFERLGESGYLALKRNEGIALIKHHPGAVLLRSLRHAVYYWTGYWSFKPEYLREEPLDPWNILFCSSYTGLVLLGLRRLWNRSAETALFFSAFLLCYPLVYYVTHPEIPYRLPVDTIGVVLGAYWLSCKLGRPKAVAAAAP